ncbi:hypothetical protein PAMP_002201 [Pampus punctatissimus]
MEAMSRLCENRLPCDTEMQRQAKSVTVKDRSVETRSSFGFDNRVLVHCRDRVMHAAGPLACALYTPAIEPVCIQ